MILLQQLRFSILFGGETLQAATSTGIGLKFNKWCKFHTDTHFP